MRRSSTHDGHGAVTSWPDHILTLQHHSSTIMEVAGVHSACNLSDHVPLAFSVDIDFNYSSTSPSRCPASQSFSCAVDWSRVTPAELDRYIEAIRISLSCRLNYLIVVMSTAEHIKSILMCSAISFSSVYSQQLVYVFPWNLNELRLFLAGMSMSADTKGQLASGMQFGWILVVPGWRIVRTA